MAELVHKKVTGNLSEEEAVELNKIIDSSPEKRKLYDELIDPDMYAKDLVDMLEFDINASWKNVKQRLANNSYKDR